MGLQISAKKRVGYKIASLIAIFAVVAQPMYGLVAERVANATPVTASTVTEKSETTNSITLMFKVKDSFNGVATTFRVTSDSNTTLPATQQTASLPRNFSADITFSNIAHWINVEELLADGTYASHGTFYVRGPNAPSFISPTPANNSTTVNNPNVTVSWSNISAASSYEYQINNGPEIPTTERSFTQAFANGTYDVKVRSVSAYGAKGNWNTVRKFTVNVYNPSETDSLFVGSPKYVTPNNNNQNSGNTSAQVHVTNKAENVRFIVNNDTTNPVDGTRIDAANPNLDRWRLYTPLPLGAHTITAEYQVNDSWHPVTGSGIAYSIKGPVMHITYPSDDRHVFRGGDDTIVRIRVDDKDKSFKRAEFTINNVKYEVTREQADLRQEGNYVRVDITKASNWQSLPEGEYTATVNAWNHANGRASNTAVATRTFTVDDTSPIVTDFTAPDLTGKELKASARVTDNNSVEQVRFFVAAPDVTGVCKNNLSALTDLAGREAVIASGTNGVYSATLNTSGLNGNYCILVSARDAAQHNSTALFKQIKVDTDAPTLEVVSPETKKLLNKNSTITLNVSDDNGIRQIYANIYKLDGAGNITGDVVSRRGLEAVNPARVGNISHTVHLDELLEDGEYGLRYSAVDGVSPPNGNRSDNAVHKFTIDNTRPTVKIVNPGVDGTFNPSVIEIEARDNTKLADLTVNVHNRTRGHVESGVCGPIVKVSDTLWTMSCNVSGLEDGKYDVGANSSDVPKNGSSGISQTVWRSFTIDKTAPVIQIEATGENANNSTIGSYKSWKNARNVTGTITDNNHSETKLFRINNGGEDTEVKNRLDITDTDDPTVKRFEVNNGLAEGTYYIIHIDKAEQESEKEYFVISNKKPLIDNVKNVISEDNSDNVAKDSDIFVGNNTPKVTFDVGNGDNANAVVDEVVVRGWIYDESKANKRGGAAFADAVITKDPATGSYEVDLKELLGTKSNWVDGKKVIVMLEAQNQANVHYQYIFTATVDTTAPVLTISVDQTDGTKNTRTISGTTDDKMSPVVVKLGSKERTIQPKDFRDNGNGTFGWSATFAGLGVANHQATVHSQDGRGNLASQVSVDFEVEKAVADSENLAKPTAGTPEGAQQRPVFGGLAQTFATTPAVLADEDNTTNPTNSPRVAQNNGGVLDADDNRANADGQAGQKGWSLANLVMVVVAGIIGLVALSGLGKKEGRVARILAVAVAVGAVSAFLIKEDMSQPMGLVNLWTIAFVAVPIVQITLLNLKKDVAKK